MEKLLISPFKKWPRIATKVLPKEGETQMSRERNLTRKGLERMTKSRLLQIRQRSQKMSSQKVKNWSERMEKNWRQRKPCWTSTGLWSVSVQEMLLHPKKGRKDKTRKTTRLVTKQRLELPWGRGWGNRSSENPGIAKIGLTPPITPILALWWIWRQKRVNATRDILT